MELEEKASGSSTPASRAAHVKRCSNGSAKAPVFLCHYGTRQPLLLRRQRQHTQIKILVIKYIIQNVIVKLVTKTVNNERVLQYYAIFLVTLQCNYENATSALQITTQKVEHDC